MEEEVERGGRGGGEGGRRTQGGGRRAEELISDVVAGTVLPVSRAWQVERAELVGRARNGGRAAEGAVECPSRALSLIARHHE